MRTSFLNVFLRNRRTADIANILLGILALLVLLLFARDMLTTMAGRTGSAIRQSGARRAAPRPVLQDYAGILEKNPFGFPGGTLTPLSPAAPASAVSRTDVYLIGTIAGSRKSGYAVFVDKKGEQQVFRIGQQVYDLGRLTKVEKTKVFLRISGKEREIPFSDLASIKEVKPGAVVPMSSFSQRAGASAYVLDQQKVQEAIKNPNQLMTDARFVPNVVGGVQQGFTLREVKSGGIYHSLGLQNGDVLLKINEYSISNPEAALQALTALRGIDRAQLEIIRNGTPLTMTYQIR